MPNKEDFKRGIISIPTSEKVKTVRQEAFYAEEYGRSSCLVINNDMVEFQGYNPGSRCYSLFITSEQIPVETLKQAINKYEGLK